MIKMKRFIIKFYDGVTSKCNNVYNALDEVEYYVRHYDGHFITFIDNETGILRYIKDIHDYISLCELY